MTNFYKRVECFSNIVIFGYADKGKIIYKLIKDNYNYKKIIFCDNDKLKQNDEDVLSVNEAVKKYKNALYIIPSPFFKKKKLEQLFNLGILDSQIMDDIPDSVYLEEGVDKRLKPLTEETFRFEFCVAKHCNLNCRSCDHFSPLIEEEFMDVEQFKKDIHQLSILFSKRAEQILILGGEPLLCPDINIFMHESRHAFPNTNIYIVTNGILLKRMDETFWRCCRDDNIGIRITRYPINIDYEKLKILADFNEVDLEYYGSTRVEERTMWHQPFDLDGKQDVKGNFLLCYSGNRCITLDNGRLYTCPIPLTSQAFNKYFNKELLISENDYVDIYQSKSSREILEALAKPIPFCRYCDLKNRKYDCPWGVSKRDIKEWTL